MACGYGACYGCVVEIDGALEAALRRRAGAVLLLNASGCLDALAAPDVARTLDAFVTKTVTPGAARGQPAGADRRDRVRDAELDRPREPGPRPLPRRDAARAARARHPALGLGRRLLGRRVRRDVRRARRRHDRAEPLVPERRRGARVGRRDRRRLPRRDRACRCTRSSRRPRGTSPRSPARSRPPAPTASRSSTRSAASRSTRASARGSPAAPAATPDRR